MVVMVVMSSLLQLLESAPLLIDPPPPKTVVMEVMSSLLQLLPLLPLLQSGGYLGTMVLMAHVSVQVSMSMHSINVPLGKTAADKRKRKEVFEVIHYYTLSAADMEEVVAAGEQQIELWLENFTATQKGLLGTTLSFYSKQYFQYFFPSKGLIPNNKYGSLVGLSPGATILQR